MKKFLTILFFLPLATIGQRDTAPKGWKPNPVISFYPDPPKLDTGEFHLPELSNDSGHTRRHGLYRIEKGDSLYDSAVKKFNEIRIMGDFNKWNNPHFEDEPNWRVREEIIWDDWLPGFTGGIGEYLPEILDNPIKKR